MYIIYSAGEWSTSFKRGKLRLADHQVHHKVFSFKIREIRSILCKEFLIIENNNNSGKNA